MSDIDELQSADDKLGVINFAEQWIQALGQRDGWKYAKPPMADQADELSRLGGKGVTTQGLTSPMSTAFDVYSTTKGGWEVAEGANNNNAMRGMQGIHDLTDGVSGLASKEGGSAGAVAGAFNTGFTIGDMLAPYVFGSYEEANRPHTEEIPQDGKSFEPSSGCLTLDPIIAPLAGLAEDAFDDETSAHMARKFNPTAGMDEYIQKILADAIATGEARRQAEVCGYDGPQLPELPDQPMSMME